jgi:hypothetical protein
MRRDVRGYRVARAAIDRRTVTSAATALRARGAGVMLRVIKLDVEWFVEACGKILQRRIVAADVRVTDLAHRNLRRRELAAMTIRAGFVTGKSRCRRVVAALVTRVAGERTVTLAAVKKLRVVLLRRGRLKEKKYGCKGANAQSNHLMSLRLIGGRFAIR